MSESSLKTTSKSIPTRRVVINSADHMPQVDYSSTPGGTLFSTTPGGNEPLRVKTSTESSPVSMR